MVILHHKTHLILRLLLILPTVSYTHLDVYKRQPSIISSPITFTSENEICDIITNDNRQFIEPFEWEKEMKDRGIVFTNDTNVVKTKFYLTENNAKNDVGELTTCLLYTSRCV